ncbi:hypothetical protein [Streptomyces sp. WAC01280]|uniref:hypothetical protein n=1 Tax=Streptomyces sp. WAC01280 TaxID=2487424 RepID=UPI000F7A81BE|nr:hypothetical protein [Streptomyces sp. WAC01280]RSS59806.1 hypothetical protein EF909_08065 [Streptomyces sp. WAC01280]
MSSSYRSWEEREAEAAKTRAEAAFVAAQAEAAKQELGAGAAKTATEQLAEQVKQARLRKQLTAVEDDAADDQAQRKERRREAALDKGDMFKRLVTVIFILGLLASLPSLLMYFLGLRVEGGPDEPALYLLPVPFFLELLAFTAVKGTQWAVRKGFARWPFWILTATLAGFAGLINGSKGAELFGPIAGIALAATSIIGPVLVEVREIIEARTAGDNRDAAQRAAGKAKARAEASAEKERQQKEQRQDADRKSMFPEQFEAYLRILASVPAGSLDRDEAWKEAGAAVRFPDVHDRMLSLIALPGSPSRPEAFAASWRDLHGGPLGVTANVLDRRLKAEADLASVLEAAEVTPERIAVDRLLAELFPTRTGGDDGPAGAVTGKGPQGPSKTPGALAGKGKQPVRQQSAGEAVKPLDPAHVTQVEKLAEALGGTDRLSVRKIRETVGCRTEYAIRLRDAVQSEQS